MHETTTFLLVTLPNIRAALGTEFLSPYPYPWGSHTHGRVQGCRGDGIFIPTPTPYPYLYPWGSQWAFPYPRQTCQIFTDVITIAVIQRCCGSFSSRNSHERGERHCVSSAVFIFSTYELLQRDFLTATAITLLELPADSKYRVAFYKFLHVM